MSNCKFCGATLRQSRDDGAKFFACGTGDYPIGQSFRTSDCHTGELARYRAMFPIPPWSTDPITPEVCERLGMVNTTKHESRTGVPFSWYRDSSGEISVRVDEDETWIAGFGYNRTAGQLACLIAARKEQAK